jgi:lysophospholipase L1-like esterase
VKTAVAAMVAQIKPVNKKFVVLSVLNASDEGTGTARYTAITALNEELKALYPYNYIDVRRALIRAYNSGNSADVTDVANDVVPTSLRSDTVHLTTAGYAVVAQQIFQFITLKGW